ncbi:MAG: DUF2267 domain-containing protein [Chitinivibrionales bacterium]|nr:DUF2267 domain-containing protein [Chitinivibrionales bacterium]
MAMTGLEAFDTTVQKSEVWLKEIGKELGWDSRQKSYKALRAVLHALRDRLTIDEGAHLSAQLPMLIRGIYYESWRPAEVPIKYRSKEEFLKRIERDFAGDPAFEPEKVTGVVLNVLKHEISSGEAQEIEQLLPGELKELWEKYDKEHAA